ncbi:hypothetical protein ACWEWD_34135 [Streptomyces tendae]
MISKKLAQRAGVVLAGAVAAGLGLSVPASAAAPIACRSVCTPKIEIAGFNAWYEATVDNTYSAPGLTSWIWVGSNKLGGHVDYYLQGEGTMSKLYNPAGGSSSKGLSKKVATFRLCGPNYVGGDFCTPWYVPATS